jgi:hypothetical protein
MSELKLQGYTSPFYDNPKSWIRPWGTDKTPISTIDSLLTDYSRNYSCFKHILLLLAKINSVTHLDWSQKAMTKEQSIFYKYGLGPGVLGTDPLGAFELCLAPKFSQETPSSASAPMLPPCLYNNWTQVTIVEVKDLKQIVATEIRHRDTNAWMEWVKYSVCTWRKIDYYICTIGRSESHVVSFLLGWSSDPDGMYCMWALFQDAMAWGNESCWTLSLLFPEDRGPVGQPLRTVKPPTRDVNYPSCLTRLGDN